MLRNFSFQSAVILKVLLRIISNYRFVLFRMLYISKSLKQRKEQFGNNIATVPQEIVLMLREINEIKLEIFEVEKRTIWK